MTKVVNLNDAKPSIAKKAANEILELGKERDLTGVLSLVFSVDDDGLSRITDCLVNDGRTSISDLLLAIKLCEKELLDNFVD